jgi:hypothetical protein
VILHQPLTYARVVATDFARSFGPTKTIAFGSATVAQWRFPPAETLEASPGARRPLRGDRSPFTYERTRRVVRRHGDEARVDASLASFLRSYQRFVYTPGSLLGIALLAAVVASVGIGRARDSGRGPPRAAIFLFWAVGVAVCLGSVAASHLSLRYQLLQLVFFPPAFALAVTAAKRRRARD